MTKWHFAALVVLREHFAASYLVSWKQGLGEVRRPGGLGRSPMLPAAYLYWVRKRA